MAGMVRVSQRSMFNNFVTNMNSSLAELMEMNLQASSQKRINKPSDDPVGTARVFNYRSQISAIGQYQENIDTARGWLGTADETLIQVNTVLTRIKELAEQAATGTYSNENRDQIAFEVREQFEQLIQLANTEFEGKHIFSGHKTQDPAFVQGLAVTLNNDALSNATPPSNFHTQGATEHTILVQFLDNATVGTDAAQYRYSDDGGDTWNTGTMAAGDNTLDLGGVTMTLDVGSTVRAVDTNEISSVNNGTWLWVRPTAIYQGDDEDVIEVDHYGGSPVAGAATGFFSDDVLLRVDNPGGVTLASNVSFSYSLDHGVSWVTGNTATGNGSNATLVIPGGYLQLSSNGGNTLQFGEQFVVRPRRADIDFEISPGEMITVNGVGKDIFGGVYRDPLASNATAALGGSSRNMFEVVGRLVGFVETNNQDGIQRALEELRDAGEHVMTQAARVGGRENRLEIASQVLSGLELSKKERMSGIEDVDVAELMTELSMQQIIYESVLKSSSTIMRMNLMNYL